MQESIRHSRKKLLIVFGLFFGPLIIALIWYYGLGAAFLQRAATNHAPLVQPVVTLQPFTNLLLDQTQINLDRLQGKWTVLHRLGNTCGESCENALYNTRQTRLALGRDSNRVQRFLLGRNVNLLETAGAEHADLGLILRINGGLDSQLTPVIESMAMGQDDALLVDPLGNVMMVIPADLNPSYLLKDLKKLLKLSKIG
jgi:cytochrome oxidase Cu insertion factor (SCO1/SenC/PrrC family)